MNKNGVVDAVVIGGGFYGATIAIYLAKQRGLQNILLVEREAALLQRASYNNQARIHNGYHYPRSFTTAYRSRINLPRFLQNWLKAVKKDFTKLYAIARNQSKVTAKQFEHFCKQIGATIQPANQTLCNLFNSRLIEQVFLVEEYAFDTQKLASLLMKELLEYKISICCNTRATQILRHKKGGLQVRLQAPGNNEQEIDCRYVFNCTYSGLNQLAGDFSGTRTGLKQEITEMALIKVPAPLDDLGITVMDGPFFSLMPFPARQLHTLSHVRYTPHYCWNDQKNNDPYQKLNDYPKVTSVNRMLRDGARYLPTLLETQYVDSLFEVKTVLTKNEIDDGRPILFEKHSELPGCYSILGGKIDNIYDVLEKLEAEPIFNKDGTLGVMNG